MFNRQFLLLSIAVTLVMQPAFADSAKDDYNRGVQAERKSAYDDAFNYFKKAVTAEPRNAKYTTAFARTRFNASSWHLHNGQLLLNTGGLKEAMTEFQRAVDIDPSSLIGQQEVRRTAELIRKEERQRDLPKVVVPAFRLSDQIRKPVELQPLSTASITLRMAVSADVAYRSICKLAGLNVVVDPDYRPQKITVELADVTLQEALDIVRLQSKTIWQPLLPNTIFVTSDSPAKRKELEQNVLRTFYLKNLATPAELTEAANTVRTILDVSRVQLLPNQDAMVVRATPDQLALVEKLISDIDKPKSEVVIDVAVMQVSRARLRTLGTNVPTSASVGVFSTASGAGAAASSGASGFGLGNFVVSVPGGSFTFLATDSNTKLLQNPRIRALNNEKATLRIGDRVPIATGSFQPGVVGGAGVSPLVSTQFQYLDVGVNVDITPHIHSDREVTLKMSLEISSVTGSQTIGGITQPVIGQRRIDHESRLVDGEVNLLGGILEDSETQSMSGYPWLSQLPLLRYLFAQDNRNRSQNEIVFAITPHIVRAQEITDENVSSIAIGSGTSIELKRKAVLAPANNAPGNAASANTVENNSHEHGVEQPGARPEEQPAATVAKPATPSANPRPANLPPPGSARLMRMQQNR